MEAPPSLLPWLQAHLSAIFFAFACCFFVFSLLLLLLRSRPWCNCDVCRAYLRSTWAAEHGNLCDWYAHLLRCSPTGTIHVHVLNQTITANPANVEHMLKTNFANYPKGESFSAILGDLLGHGIFNVDGEPWRFQRKMASLELGSSAVRHHAFSAVSDELRLRLLPLLRSAAGAPLDLQDAFRRFSFHTICNISFGLDPNSLLLSLPMSAFAAAFDKATRLSAYRGASAAPVVWRMKRLLSVGSEKELKQAVALVDELAREVIRERRRIGIGASNDLLSRFMASIDDEKYLRDIVVSFLLAGRDTVAASLTGFFLLLADHPAVEAAILGEIEAVSGEVASYGELRGMQYVHAAVYECMRLYPPVQFDSKFCADDDVLPDGTFVREGERVTYHPYAMGRMESIWGGDWPEFRPERWLSGGVFTPQSPFKYPVFQGGLRVCLGKELAVMEMKAAIVSILREFHIDVVGAGRKPRFAPGLTATFSGGIRAAARPRRRPE